MRSVPFWAHFKRLAQFSGREDRASFWPYAAFVFGFTTLSMGVATFPVLLTSMRKMQAFAAAHPDQATVTSGPGHHSVSIRGHHPELMPDMGALVTSIAIPVGLAVLLYAAAVARRLHDRGMSGFWGLLPLPFLVYSLVQTSRLFASGGSEQPFDPSLFFSIFASNLFYLIALATLVVLLAGRGRPEPNRYG